jgi:hypothetical protein
MFYKIYVILNVKLITSELYVFTREFMKDNWQFQKEKWFYLLVVKLGLWT